MFIILILLLTILDLGISSILVSVKVHDTIKGAKERLGISSEINTNSNSSNAKKIVASTKRVISSTVKVVKPWVLTSLRVLRFIVRRLRDLCFSVGIVVLLIELLVILIIIAAVAAYFLLLNGGDAESSLEVGGLICQIIMFQL